MHVTLCIRVVQSPRRRAQLKVLDPICSKVSEYLGGNAANSSDVRDRLVDRGKYGKARIERAVVATRDGERARANVPAAWSR